MTEAALNVARTVQSSIQQVALAAAERGEEACGIMWCSAAHPRRIIGVTHVANVAADRRHHYRLPDSDVLQAYTERPTGADLAGWWHSHPRGPGRLSVTDLAAWSDSSLMHFLYDVPGAELTAWRQDRASASNLAVQQVAILT